MFAYSIDTSIDINADADAVWRVLSDFSRFEEWNPMLRNLQTELAPGAMVRFEVLREGASSLKLKAKIVELIEARALAWRGGPPGILTGEHYFNLEPLEDGRCRFSHGERFGGLLLPLVKGALKDAPSLYRAMNESLKKRVEGKS
jgi:hypothetical protein